MRLEQALLRINAVAFVAFGIAFIAAPQTLAETILGVAPTASSAMIDMRATYGGFAFGAGVFFGLCATRASWVRPGLIACAFSVGGIGAARLVGIVVDGSPNGFMWLFLAFEVLFVALCAIAVRGSSSVAERPASLRSPVA